MHNNFLVDRRGKMSKSSGEFLTLQALVDRGYHPLAYRMMCLQAHYRSELEFTWEGLGAALTRLKRVVMQFRRLTDQLGADWSATSLDWILSSHSETFSESISEDLNTPRAITAFEDLLFDKKIKADEKIETLKQMNEVLGLGLLDIDRTDLRIRPKSAEITEEEIEAKLVRRKEARAAKDFATSDAIRDELAAKGVEVMDGDPLGWEWKL